MANSSNKLISKILAHNIEANEDLTKGQAMSSSGQVQAIKREARLPLRVSSHVIELEITPKKPPETYDKEVTCDIIDASKAGRLAGISEDQEFDAFQDDFNARFESM